MFFTLLIYRSALKIIGNELRLPQDRAEGAVWNFFFICWHYDRERFVTAHFSILHVTAFLRDKMKTLLFKGSNNMARGVQPRHRLNRDYLGLFYRRSCVAWRVLKIQLESFF